MMNCGWPINNRSKRLKNYQCALSASTVKCRLHAIRCEWVQPPLHGGGFVHLDVTYWGLNFGVLLALDTESGKPLYLSFVKSETVKDYEDAVASIEKRGYAIRGLIIDGKKSLFKSFSEYHVQMCQFHMKQIVRRYLALNPRMLASRDLKTLVDKLHRIHEADFRSEYQAWKEKWKDTIARRSLHKDGRLHYVHGRLRTALISICLISFPASGSTVMERPIPTTRLREHSLT